VFAQLVLVVIQYQRKLLGQFTDNHVDSFPNQSAFKYPQAATSLNLTQLANQNQPASIRLNLQKETIPLGSDKLVEAKLIQQTIKQQSTSVIQTIKYQFYSLVTTPVLLFSVDF
jgi:hypothetical protein